MHFSMNLRADFDPTAPVRIIYSPPPSPVLDAAPAGVSNPEISRFRPVSFMARWFPWPTQRARTVWRFAIGDFHSRPMRCWTNLINLLSSGFHY